MEASLAERAKVHNFNAGPSPLPQDVLVEAAQAVLSFPGSPGVGICEISHRDTAFLHVMQRAQKSVQLLYGVPDEYEVFFMQGGGWGQFSATALNLAAWHHATKKTTTKPKGHYVITGSWSKKAVGEAARVGIDVQKVSYDDLKTHDFSGADYVYYCDNETIDGAEFNHNDPFPFDKIPEGVPVVSDMSSNFLSRPVDVSKYGIIYAGAQKNLGPAGITVVIVRKDLIVKPDDAVPFGAPVVPEVMSYDTMRVVPPFNTPPTFVIYVCGLVLEKLKHGPPSHPIRNVSEAMIAWNSYANVKSSMVYSIVDNYPDVYVGVQPEQRRSRMNLTFRLRDEELTSEFLQRAKAAGLVGLNGHRSVGGIRASLYNAVTLDDVHALCGFLRRFAEIAQELKDRNV